jgi:hypothetical protein
LWSLFFWKEEKGASFFSLLLSFLLCLEGARRGGGEAYQLLSGWLLLATCLNFLIWNERRDVSLLLLRSACLATSLLSVLMKMPFFPLPVAWGVAWMERVGGRERALLVLLLSGGSCLSLLR